MNYQSLYEARFAIRYGARIHERSARAWQKLSTLLVFTEILCGSAAFAAYIASNAELSAGIGLLLAACAAINQTARPTEKAVCETALVKKFMTLLADQAQSLDKLNIQLWILCGESNYELECLRNPAYNDVARENGRDDHCILLSCFQKIAALLG